MVEAMVFIPGESCLNFFLPSGTDCSIISAANGDFSIWEAARRINMTAKALRLTTASGRSGPAADLRSCQRHFPGS